MEDKVNVSLEISTLGTLIAGLHCTYSNTDPIAIPPSLYLELAEKLVPYLEDWNYDNQSFEEWVRYCLLIIPKVMIEDDIEEFEMNELYFERDNGNIVLVVTADMNGVSG